MAMEACVSCSSDNGKRVVARASGWVSTQAPMTITKARTRIFILATSPLWSDHNSAQERLLLTGVGILDDDRARSDGRRWAHLHREHYRSATGDSKRRH